MKWLSHLADLIASLLAMRKKAKPRPPRSDRQREIEREHERRRQQ